MVPVSVSNPQLLRGQGAATPELSSKHPPAVAAVTLHELWCEFGNTVNGATRKVEAARRNLKHKKLVCSISHHCHKKMTVLTLNIPLARLSPDIFCFFSIKKPVLVAAGKAG